MRQADDRGYAMAALLVAISVMAIVLSAAMPSWLTMAKREREAELVFRGQQYARAITLFQRKFAAGYPPNLDVLLSQRFLRKKYKDPITRGDFRLIAVGDAAAVQAPGSATPGGASGLTPPGGRGPATPGQTGGTAGVGVAGVQTGIQGVVSTSPDESLRVYNGRTHYNEWVFIAAAATTAAGGVGGPGAAGEVGAGGVPTGGARGGGARGGGPQGGQGRGGFPSPPGGRTGFPPGGPGQGPGLPGFPPPGGTGRGRF